jgi:hypothetical protein
MDKTNWGLEASTIIMETVFLHGGSMEEIFMSTPKSMNEDQGYCLSLKKTINSLVNIPRGLCKKLILVLKSIEIEENRLDSCLLSN